MEEDEIMTDSEQSAAIEDMEENSLVDSPVGEIVGFVKEKFSKADSGSSRSRGDSEIDNDIPF